MLVFACISPHPPILLPNVGSPEDRAKVAKTIKALERLSTELAEVKPDIIIISSPHPDWGVEVPWHFLRAKLKVKSPKLPASPAGGQFKVQNYQEASSKFTIDDLRLTIYPILTTLDSPRQHYEWGKQIAAGLPRALRGAWIASGDMSHRLREDGPYGLHPSGPKFDQKFIELLKKKDVEGILNLDPELVEEAGECGLRSFCLLLGALDALGVNWQPEILSYEGPFGVGYLVANLKIETD